MSLIPLTGIPSTLYVPGTFAELYLAQGVSTASAGAREIVFVMPKTSSGTFTVNTLVQVRSEDEAKQGGGVGSPLHRAFRIALKANPRAKFFALPYAETSGGSASAADGYIELDGTATKGGLVRVMVAGEEIEIGVSTGDTGSDLGALLAATVNAREHLPCTASNDAGLVTLTAKIDGKSQGDGTTGVIRFRAEVSPGIGISVEASGEALGLGAGNAGVDGTTTEAANLATALATIDNVRKYYIGVSVWDSTALGNVQTHVSNKSLPAVGHRSVAVAAFTGTLADGQTLATARNFERLQIVWMPKSEHDCAELVGNMVAVRQKYESRDSAYNFDSHRGSDWLIKKHADAASIPDMNDLNDALTDGLTPISSDGVGSFVVFSSTTRSKNAAGTVDDRRAAETHRLSVCDEFMDTHLIRHANTYTAFKLKDDEYLEDGSVNPNQRVIKGVLTPSQYKPFVQSIMREFDATGKLKNLQSSLDGLEVVLDPSNGGRLEVQYGLDVINLLHQTTIRVNEVSAG